MNTAQAQLSDAQDAAGHLQTLPTHARAAANAAIDEPAAPKLSDDSPSTSDAGP